MKLGDRISGEINLSGWRSEMLDDAIHGLANQIKQLVIDSAKEAALHLLTEDSTCYFTNTADGLKLRICAGTQPNDPEWDIDIKKVIEFADIEGDDAALLASYFNDISEFLRKRAAFCATQTSAANH